MDRERKKRNRAIRIVLVDILMVISVVAIVIVLVGVVAGWRFGNDMTLEQNGLVQIDSKPTGATVIIDGEAQMMGTNTSKMLSSGQHEITLEKEGYDSWSKTIEVTAGWLLNLRYPRLFLEDRSAKTVLELDGLNLLSSAPDRKSLVYITEDGTKWHYVTNLNGEKPKDEEIVIAELALNESGSLLPSEIKWNKNSDRVLIKTTAGEWVYFNLKNPNESINISRDIVSYTNFEELTRDFADRTIQTIVLANNSGTDAFALINSAIFKISLIDHSLSATPLVDISEFATWGSEVVFATNLDEENLRRIGLYKDGDKNAVDVELVEGDNAIRVGLSEYYGQKYVVFSVGDKITVLRGDSFPSNDISEMVEVNQGKIFVTPNSLEISDSGEFFVFREGRNVVVYDAEIEKYTEYAYINEQTEWLDGYILYGVENGMLEAWDFDGTNARTLVKENVLGPALISANDKYLYYVGAGENGAELKREKLEK